MSKRHLIVATKLLISVGLLAILFVLADPRSVLERLRGIAVPYFAIGVAILIGQVALSTLKWRVILAAEGYRESFTLLMRTYLIGNFLSLFLPTSFGGDIYRVAELRKRVATAKSTASVLFDRLTGLMALATIAVSSTLFIWDSIFVGALAAAAVMSGLAAFLIATSDRFSTWIEGRATNRYVFFIYQLVGSFRAYKRDKRVVVTALVISLFFQLNIVVINYYYTLALDLDIPFSVLMMVIPLAYLTEVIPLSINGIGVRDSALVALLLAFGYPAEAGLSIGLLIIAGRYLLGALGGTLFAITSARST